MMRETVKPFKVLVLVLTLLPVSVVGARGESGPIHDAIATQDAASVNVRLGLPTTLKQLPRRARRNPCDLKKRALVGAGVGAVIAMVAVQRIAADYDSTVGAKATLYVGGYGAAIGGFIGLKTCR